MKKTNLIKDYNELELSNLCTELGFNEFNGKQIFKWLFHKKCFNFQDMSNLPTKLRNKLIKDYTTVALTISKVATSKIDKTTKFLFKTYDGKYIETVSMIEKNRHTVCLSSQIGCNVDCDFCATGKMGLSRNLTAGEIIEQLILVTKNIKLKISNIVFMGMGEPFLNYNNVIKACNIFADTNAFNLSQKKITRLNYIKKVSKLLENVINDCI